MVVVLEASSFCIFGIVVGEVFLRELLEIRSLRRGEGYRELEVE